MIPFTLAFEKFGLSNENFRLQNKNDTNRQCPGRSFDPPIQYSSANPIQSNKTRARKKRDPNRE
jgi:hypothetical protein